MDKRELSNSEISSRLDDLLGAVASRDRQYQDPLIGRQLGPYSVVERLGSGSFGIVYRAHDSRTSIDVAIKLLHAGTIATKDALIRFEKEAMIAARLQHPFIVKLLEKRLTESLPFLVSEYVDGIDLGNWHARQCSSPQPAGSILTFVHPLIEAVEYAHSQGVIHRDIKPSNVLLKKCDTSSVADELSHYRPMLTDFGLAKFTTELIPDSRSSLTIGTPMYMAPEQLVPTWGRISARTDIYAIGVLMAELANGRPLRFGMNFSEVMRAVLRNGHDVKVLWADDVPKNFRNIVLRCLEKDPIDRYPNVAELRRDIEAIMVNPLARAPGGSFFQKFKSWARNPARPVEVCFFVITLNLIMFAWMLFNAYLITGPYYHGNERMSDLVQCLGIAIGNNLVTAILCGLRIIDMRWAAWAALILTTSVTVVVPVLTVLDAIQTFRGLYENAPFFRIANHAQILLFGLIQSTLLAICVYSDLSSQRRHRETHYAESDACH